MDNIAIAREVLHSMRRRREIKSEMALKFELEKAYDCISWQLLTEVLLKVVFSVELVRLIMLCVSFSSLSNLWNREVLESFKPSRGRRQDDPLSPYLFVLCMEVLGHMIKQEVDNGHEWKPV